MSSSTRFQSTVVVLTVIVMFVMLSPFTVVGQTKGNILVYSTADGQPPGNYPKDWFNVDLKATLEVYGYTVTVTDRIDTPEITSAFLTGYDQLWIMSADADSIAHFSQDEINTILAFRDEGHGLLIMAEHTDAQGNSFANDANQIANPLGVNFYGWVDHGVDGANGAIVSEHTNHPLFYQVTTICGHPSEALMTTTPPVKVVARYQGDKIIAVLDNEYGRVVFDVTFVRAWQSDINIGDNRQYIRNIADWLQHGDFPGYEVPSLSQWSLVILTTLLLIGGVALIVLKKRQAPRLS